MAVRDHLARPDISAVDPERPVIVFDDAPARDSRRVRRLGLAGLLAAAVVFGAVSWWTGSWWMAGAGGNVEARPAAEAPAPAPVDVPAGLVVSVQGPRTVVAGQPARFVVSYSDGEAIFGGVVEDWGDTGVGSVSLAACDASAPSAAPLRGRYVATHRWPRAASHPVSFAVTTYTCHDGQARLESRNARLTVVVHAR